MRARVNRLPKDTVRLSLPAVTISLDATFKCAKKVKITTANGMHFDPAKGGLISAVNEISQTVSWHDAIVHALHDDAAGSTPNSDKTNHSLHCTAVTTQPQQQPADITDAPQCPAATGDPTSCACTTDGKLTGRKLKQIIADNCCHICKALERAFPDVAIGLDVFHFLMSGADGEKPAKYWLKEEQEEKLQAAYTKWERRGSIWSVAAAKVHAAQMQHIRKGCLTRAVQDVASDGSCIKGFHKGWNSIMRSHPCGIEVFVALGHDHILCRNIHIEWSSGKTSSFVLSTHGCHHLRLVNQNAKLWNTLVNQRQRKGQQRNDPSLVRQPEMQLIPSKERFRLVHSEDAETYGGMLPKEEPKADEQPLLEMAKESDRFTFGQVGSELNIEPALFFLSQGSSTTTSASTATKHTVDGAMLISARGTDARPHAVASSTLAMTTTVAASATSIMTTASAPATSAGLPPHAQSPPIDPILLAEEGRNGEDSRIAQEPEHTRATGVDLSVIDLTQDDECNERTGDRLNGNTGGTHVVSTDASASGATPRPAPRKRKASSDEAPSTAATSHRQPAAKKAHTMTMAQQAASQQLASFAMTPRKWVVATAEYNRRLAESHAEDNLPAPVIKHPRALVEQLPKVEDIIINRIVEGNYKSQSGKLKFWTENCAAVLLLNEEQTSRLKKSKKCMPQRCHRCKTLKYSCGVRGKGNHRRDCCSDGACSNLNVPDKPPPWPQPEGIFEAGKMFHVMPFFAAVRTLYETLVLRGEHISTLALEYEAFGAFLRGRLINAEGVCLFPLYDKLTLVGLPLPTRDGGSLIVQYHNKKCLRYVVLAVQNCF
ncbi:hypothetical protein EWM64_g1796 [Hericium alpestre]|uniref:Uncharacterized protein n=1 Tax=Hericium alpestre TaxID=135208 RepID=A0A4Z0A794_9AGAM|nr:hypothetical protein EWM64_g1796 [Hericium alpestre]